MLVHGTCHHDCPDSCGWTVTVDDGVAVKLRGRADHPYSAGELCPKVNRFLDRVYSPDRVLHPLRRTGPVGCSRPVSSITRTPPSAASTGSLNVKATAGGLRSTLAPPAGSVETSTAWAAAGLADPTIRVRPVMTSSAAAARARRNRRAVSQRALPGRASVSAAWPSPWRRCR